MSFLQWTHDLDTNIGWIDDQHKKIVDYINELYVAKQSADRNKIGQIMKNLIDYTATHFTEEEQMMERAGYPLTTVHRSVHERFVEKVSDLNTRHHGGADTADDLLRLLESWLFSHIRTNDHGYVSAVKGAGADKR